MKNWGGVLSGGGAAALSLLSCAMCPFCLPLYLGLLSVVGIELDCIHGFVFPIMILFCLLSLGIMANQIYKHHGSWHPFFLAIAGGFGMGLSSFYEQDLCLYMSVALFMGGILWSRWTLEHKEHGCC